MSLLVIKFVRDLYFLNGDLIYFENYLVLINFPLRLLIRNVGVNFNINFELQNFQIKSAKEPNHPLINPEAYLGELRSFAKILIIVAQMIYPS